MMSLFSPRRRRRCRYATIAAFHYVFRHRFSHYVSLPLADISYCELMPLMYAIFAFDYFHAMIIADDAAISIRCCFR
jgi:hypothetical protein